jgi:hypothetical protein
MAELSDRWTDEDALVNVPRQAQIQSDLLYGCRANVDAYNLAGADEEN